MPLNHSNLKNPDVAVLIRWICGERDSYRAFAVFRLSLPGLYEQDGSKNCKALEYFKGRADNIH